MRKILPILLISLLLCGCNPLKRNIRQQNLTSASSEHNVDIDQVKISEGSVKVDEGEKTESTGVREAEQITDQVSVKITETFDTDKPVDPQTGTPPLKDRTTEITGRSDNIKSREEVKENTERQSDTASEQREQTDTSMRLQDSEQSGSSAISEVAEQKGQAGVWKWLKGILAGAILTIAIYFIIKNKTKCLKIIRQLLT